MSIYVGPNITIYKYPFEIADTITISLPEGAEIIKWDCQDGVPCAWAMVDPDNLTRDQRFQLRGTGQPLRKVGKHLATFFHGPFVWHVFEDPTATGEEE